MKENDGVLDESSMMLCPCCCHPNDPVVAFCQDCGAPIGNYAAIDPIQRIYAEGFAYRAAVSGPPKIIILVGIWMIFSPMILFGLTSWLTPFDLAIRSLGTVAGLVGLIICGRVTWNFYSKRILKTSGV